MPEFTVYARSDCHLCEDMLSALAPLQARHRFTVNVIDIAGCPELEARYGEKVPVLVQGEREVCHYFLDPQALEACLR